MIYNTLFSDTFKRANESPLNPATWSDDPSGVNSPLQIVNGEACPTASESFATPVGITLTDDHWVEVQVDACTFNSYVGFDFASVLLVARRLNTSNGYALEIDGPLGPNCNVSFFKEVAHVITMFVGTADGGVPMPLFAGDKIRLEAIGNRITAKINGVVIASVIDNGLPSGGEVALDLFEDNVPADAQVSNFSCGSITDSFLGSVRIVGSAPAGVANPKLGTVKVLASAPAGASVRYLGNVVSGSAAAGAVDPQAGEIVIVGSAPAGDDDPFIGTIIEG